MKKKSVERSCIHSDFSCFSFTLLPIRNNYNILGSDDPIVRMMTGIALGISMVL